MIIETFVQTAFQQNTRVVACEQTRKAICIDPGEPSDAVVAFINDNDLELQGIILTHGHLDHVGGTLALSMAFPDAEILIHKDEEPLYYSLPPKHPVNGMPPPQEGAKGRGQ